MMKPKFTRLLYGLLLLLIFHLTGLPALAEEPAPVLAFYYAWFDQNSWSSGQAAALPSQPYESKDPATIQRHVTQAQQAGIDAFVQSWYGPQETNNQTETNFRALLDIAAQTGFQAAVDFETTGPFFANIQDVTNALASLVATHLQHPAYFRYQGKPVIFFWRQQRFSVEQWADIRRQVDPDHNTYWIAEGVDIAYQAVFDGHHLYSIAWADSPANQLAKWGGRVRAYPGERLWIATVMPGYDDTNLPRADAFAVPRRNGAYYRQSWQAALNSQPDMIIITSFNEWLEGTQIEPSPAYGNLYLDITRQLSTGQAPVQKAAAVSPPQQTTATPEQAYLRIENLTNLRSGPASTYPRIGTIPADSLLPVTGRVQSNRWWQVDFEEKTGWVSAEAVEFVGRAADVPVILESQVEEELTATPPPTGTMRITVPAGPVNLRSGPGLSFEEIGQLETDASLPLTGRDETGDWWQVEYDAGPAWVAASVVNVSGNPAEIPIISAAAPGEPSPTPTETPTPEPIIEGEVEATDPINVRSEPSLEGERVGGLYPGETAEVLAVSPDGEWWQIAFADSPDGTGWIAAEFVAFEGDRLSVPIFGVGTVTPTPGPTDTPTATPPPPSPTPVDWPPTFAPTATSPYQATADTLLTEREATPDSGSASTPANAAPFNWQNLPWGIVSGLAVVAFLWYQWRRRNR